MRLQKYLAQCGVASRRKSETYILEGRVAINGHVIRELGVKVEEDDQVTFDNKVVKQEGELVYYMLNKPIGYITSVQDEKDRATVMELVKAIPYRIFPVGRLDYNTAGLLLMTNDGDLTYALTHPKHDVNKTYIAKVKGTVTRQEITKLKQGVNIEGYITAPAIVSKVKETPSTTTLSITIHEGRNRQVRKMCEAINHEVLKLSRVSIGELEVQELELGKYRKLSEKEVKYLKQLGGMANA